MEKNCKTQLWDKNKIGGFFGPPYISQWMNIEALWYLYASENPSEMSCYIYLFRKKFKKRMAQNCAGSIPIRIPIS